MVAVDMQPILNDFGKGQVEVDALEEELEWSDKWGYSFSLFRGLFEIAQRNSIPIAGLNTPTRITKKISKEGIDSLTEEERAFLPVEIVPPSNAQTPLLDMILPNTKTKTLMMPHNESASILSSLSGTQRWPRKPYDYAKNRLPVLIIAERSC